MRMYNNSGLRGISKNGGLCDQLYPCKIAKVWLCSCLL